MKLNGEEKFGFTTEQEKRMVQEINILTGSKEESAQPHSVQVSIRMLQSEHTGQPIYSNFTLVHNGQGMVIVDFGFLDLQTTQALGRMIRAGEKTPDTINAKMSCRMAINIDAANQLARQLNQMLGSKVNSQAQTSQHDVAAQGVETAANEDVSDEKDTSESHQSGFRFPWSKKTR